MTAEQEVRLLQVFLGKNGTYEVSLRAADPAPGKGPDLACNCPGYSVRRSCKHTRYVLERWDEHDGYIVRLPPSCTVPEPADLADAEAWRRFVVENAPVVVL